MNIYVLFLWSYPLSLTISIILFHCQQMCMIVLWKLVTFCGDCIVCGYCTSSTHYKSCSKISALLNVNWTLHGYWYVVETYHHHSCMILKPTSSSWIENREGRMWWHHKQMMKKKSHQFHCQVCDSVLGWHYIMLCFFFSKMLHHHFSIISPKTG